MTELHEKLAEMLEIIWRGIPASFKRRYRMSIWQQFEDQIRSAAYTVSLSKFVSSLCLKLDANVGRNAEDRVHFDELFRGLNPQSKQVLKLLREETTLLVLMVRVSQQGKREAWLEKQKQEEGGIPNLFTEMETER